MKRFGVRWMCAVAAGVLTLAVGHARVRADADTMRSETLRNGMQIIVAPDPRAASVDLSVWYRAGTLTEASGRSGSSFVLGRLMFFGSEHFAAGRHIRHIQAAGGAMNSTVNPDYSRFFQTLPPEALETALELEADRMRALTFDKDDVSTVLAALRTQRARVRQGSSVALGLERLFGLAFEGHPYAWPVTGREEDLDRITAPIARDYHRKYFAPEHAVVTIVGRVDADAVLAAARQHFESLPRRTRRAPDVPVLKPLEGGRRATEVGAVNRMMLIGWRGPGSTSEDLPALQLLAEVLVGGSGSRLMRTPVAPGVAAQGDFDQRRLASLLYCMAAPRPGVDTVGIERALIERIEAAAVEEISEQELERAKKRIEAGVTFAQQTPSGVAEQIGIAQVMTGDYRLAGQRIATIRGLGAADVQRAARKVLRPERRTVVWLFPDDREEGLGR